MAWKVNAFCAFLAALGGALIGLTAQALVKSAPSLYPPSKKQASLLTPQPSSTQSSTSTSAAATYRLGGTVALVSAPLLFCFMPLSWEYSVTSEVFALNNFLCSALVYLSTLVCLESSWANGSNKGIFYTLLGAFVCGLGLSNQHASLLFMAVLVPCCLWQSYKRRPDSVPRVLFLSSICFFLGLSPYFFMYLNTLSGPAKEGSWGDLRSFRGIIRHFLRSEYGTFQLGMTLGKEGFLERLWHYVRHASRESKHLSFPLLLLSVVLYWPRGENKNENTVQKEAEKEVSSSKKQSGKSPNIKHMKINSSNDKNASKEKEVDVATVAISQSDDSTAFKVLLTTYTFYLIIWHLVLSNLPLDAPMPYGVHSRFWMQPNILLAVFAGLGLELVVGKVLSLALAPKSHTEDSLSNKQSSRTLALVISFAIFAVLFQVFVVAPFSLMDRSRTGWVMHKFAELTLNTFPTNSLLASHTDLDWNTIRYLGLFFGPHQPHLEELHTLNPVKNMKIRTLRCGSADLGFGLCL